MVEIIFVGALSQEMQCAAPNKVPRMRSAPGGVSNIGATHTLTKRLFTKLTRWAQFVSSTAVSTASGL